jgi:predicted porin
VGGERRGLIAVLALVVSLAADPAPAQAPVQPSPVQTTTPLGGEPSPLPIATPLGVQPLFGPLFGPYTAPPSQSPAAQVIQRPGALPTAGRAAPPTAQPERLLLTPSLLVGESYTDNVFLDNAVKQADFITSFTPGLLLGLREPTFGVSLGYVFTSEIYATLSELNAAQARQAATVAGFYRVDPRLSFTLAGGYLEDNNTTASGIAGVSTGRTRSRGGAVTPGLTWQVEPLTTLELTGSWYTQSFEGSPLSPGAAPSTYDTTTAQVALSRRITPTLTGLGSYQFLTSEVSNGDDARYHLLQIGVGYRITENLAARLLVGPQATTEGDTGTSLAVQFGVTRVAPWGSLGLSYLRVQQPNGGLGGTSQTNTVAASLTAVDLFAPGLTAALSPVFTTTNAGNGLIDTRSIGVELVATYPITPWMVAVIAYSFFRQRSFGSQLANVDANRVAMGLQFFHRVPLK